MSQETKALDVGLHRTKVLKVVDFPVPDPEFGDFKLNIFPVEHNGQWIELPRGFEMWEAAVNHIFKFIEYQEGSNIHYITIDSKFFPKDEHLRREGVHIDGNFCVDPNFVTWRDPKLFKESWGGGRPKPGWSGAYLKEGHFKPLPNNEHVDMDWVFPYDTEIPVGQYVSGNKGGIFCVSTEVGCQAWDGEFYGEILSQGACDDIEKSGQLTDDKKIVFDKNKLYFMTSNTPHETLLIKGGKRRTLIRVTLNCEYENDSLIEKLGG